MFSRRVSHSMRDLQLPAQRRHVVATQAGGGLQIGACGRIVPEQGEDVAAEDIEVRFAGRQPNRLREISERGPCGVRRSEMYPAAVLPRLPQIWVEPKRFIEERERPGGRPRCGQADSLVENRG